MDLVGADLSEIFGIDIEVETSISSMADVAKLVCAKCRGSGKFVSYTGRVVGKCFACEGSGLARSAGVELKADDCQKCVGTGLWAPGRECLACSGSGKVAEERDINVRRIEEAFAAARSNGVKSPKLRLDTFVFSRAPDHGRNAGAIYVKQDGEYLGKVVGGKFAPVGSCDAETAARVIAAAADPHAAAKAYGLRTGVCSCCGRELTNGMSIELGIGPICRDKFGW